MRQMAASFENHRSEPICAESEEETQMAPVTFAAGTVSWRQVIVVVEVVIVTSVGSYFQSTLLG